MTFNPIKEMTFFLDFDNFFVFRVAFDPRVRKLPCMAIWMFEARFCREFNILAEQWTKRAKEFPEFKNPHVETEVEQNDKYALYRIRTYPNEFTSDEMTHLITLMQVEFEGFVNSFKSV